MRLPATWTHLMAFAIAAYSTVLFAQLFGGNWLAWLFALPAMFVGLQLLGLPIVMLCEVVERSGILPRRLRPLVDEIVIVGCLTASGFWLLSASSATAMVVFFAVMYAVRLLAGKLWLPGETEEVRG